MKQRFVILGLLALAFFAAQTAPVFAEDAVTNCTGEGGFVSLSCIPGFTAAVGAGGLTAFFNLLYQMCIGAAAVLAVLQITRAGIMYMGGDSITEKKEAKHLISVSLLGLMLVLSPVLVFSLINPDINNFDLLTGHTTDLTVPDTGGSAPPGGDSSQPTSCQNKTNPTYVPIPTNQSCRDVKGDGWVGIDNACCAATDPGGTYQCCAKDANYTPPAPTETEAETSAESSYSDEASIPAGLWCYQTSGMYVCNSSSAGCGAAAATEDEEPAGGCVKH